MVGKLCSIEDYSIFPLPFSWIAQKLYLFLFILQILLITPSISKGSEIIVRLSGETDHPGDLSVLSKTIKIRKICFLGIDAKGKIDKNFLRLISSQGTPKGTYKVAPPSPDEQWPAKSFTKNGALRLKIIAGSGLKFFNTFNKKGLAIHGRDFYPLLDKVVKKKKMISFYNDLLFEKLKNHWGPLRISNWDMGRLADSWVKMNQSPKQWKVKVIGASPEKIEGFCKPPVTKRSPD